ncbi:MAG: thiamine phosphate synthase [Chloroflexi bacterium]|nr:thiamine phosphate synthase [Chloroflexota bacterium]
MTGARLPRGRPVICLITDRRLTSNVALESVVSAAVEGGVNLVQLREKDLPTRELLALARRLRDALAGRAPLVINSRADIALAAHTDGVHLPADGLSIEGARAVLGTDALVGQSVHSVEEVARCIGVGADYVELGTVFSSRSHPEGPVIGVDAIRAAATHAIPILAVGGITPENASDLIRAGAAGVAVISAILAAADPRTSAARLADAAMEAWATRSPAGV